jgi:hypothetical protein
MSSYIKRLRAKAARKAKNIQNASDLKNNEAHKTSASIFRLALRNENDIELLLNPVKDRRIISMPGKGVYIVLEKTLLEITNHTFSYHLEIGFDLYTRLSKLFDIKLSKMRDEYEKDIVNQMDIGLKKVLETFK